MEFIYPLPDRPKQTTKDKIELLESYHRYINTNADHIEMIEYRITNPSDTQNLFRTRQENIDELKEAQALRDRLMRMWNRLLNDLVIR